MSIVPIFSLLIIVATTPLYAQEPATFTVTFDDMLSIDYVEIEELVNSSVVYYSEIDSIKVTNETYNISYQFMARNTEMALLTIHYYDSLGAYQSYSELFVVKERPLQEKINWFALGFVIFVACLGSFYTFRYIRRKRF